MIGNAAEWCDDGYGDYPAGPVDDPKGQEDAARRVVRGAAWTSSPAFCRCAARGNHFRTERVDAVGFRICLNF
jgi:formylglycine-generating enzyme required for sulfatase activity